GPPRTDRTDAGETRGRPTRSERSLWHRTAVDVRVQAGVEVPAGDPAVVHAGHGCAAGGRARRGVPELRGGPGAGLGAPRDRRADVRAVLAGAAQPRAARGPEDALARAEPDARRRLALVVLEAAASVRRRLRRREVSAVADGVGVLDHPVGVRSVDLHAVAL